MADLISPTMTPPTTRRLIRQGAHFYDAATHCRVDVPEHVALTISGAPLPDGEPFTEYYTSAECRTRAQIEEELHAHCYGRKPYTAFRHLLPAGTELRLGSSGPYAFALVLDEDLFWEGYEVGKPFSGRLTDVCCRGWASGSAFPIRETFTAQRLYWLVYNLRNFYFQEWHELSERAMLEKVFLPDGRRLWAMVDEVLAAWGRPRR